jgi:hypothetical protein
LRHRVLSAIAVAVLSLAPAAAPAGAGKKPEPPLDLPAVHANLSQTVRLRTPADWKVTSRPGDPEVTEARGGPLLVRILRRGSEWGIDSLHVDCMQVRLAGAMETRPEVEYEYDFVGGPLGERQVLDSAFVVHYDTPVEGERDWRQRNLTVVGGGESSCVIGYAPAAAWKKSKDLKRLLDSVVASVEMRPWQ